MCYSVLQCDAVCCSVLQCVAVWLYTTRTQMCNVNESRHTCVRATSDCKGVMWMSHVTHSCEWVTSHLYHTCEWVSWLIEKRHITHTNEASYHTYETTHIRVNESCHTFMWMSHVTLISHMCMSVMTHSNASYHTHVWVINASYHTYEWVMSHDPFKCVISHIWISHIAHTKQHTFVCATWLIHMWKKRVRL